MLPIGTFEAPPGEPEVFELNAYMEKGGVEVVALNEVALEKLRAKLYGVVSNFIQDADAKGIPASAFVEAYSK